MTVSFRATRNSVQTLRDAAWLDEDGELLVVAVRCGKCGEVFIQGFDEAAIFVASGFDHVCLLCDEAAEARTATPTLAAWFLPL